MQQKIICIGGANIDFKLKSQHPILLNTSNPVTSSNSFGGVARNVAHNLAKLTTHIYLQCVVGNDEQGRSLLEHMQLLGVDTQYSQILDGKRTSHYHAILNDQGELFIGLADMGIYEEINHSFINSSCDFWGEGSIVFLDTNLPADVIDLILVKADLFDLKICIDPVSVEKTKKLPLRLDSVFLIKPDLHEASILSGIAIDSIDDCIQAGLKINEKGVKNTIISLGKAGYVVVNDKHREHIKAEEISIVADVSGAGDAFIAGILFGLQQGKDILSACQIGAKLATQTIQSVDTVANVDI